MQNNPVDRNRILVVSLQTELISMLRYLFSADDLELVTAQEPLEVFEKLACTGAKVLLLDLHLPTADALRLLKVIRAKCPQVFVITIAESACRELAAASIILGANEFLLEPFDFQVLRRLLRTGISENFAYQYVEPITESRGHSSGK
ncbi:MAG: hypothetical protein DMG05_23770 [Acidobacteria bacterium]|nr:MAG: hypothetical protein DMG05_23770 [Acidobacteriota bacterium]